MSLWRPWLGIGKRCFVPATSFAEWTPKPNPATGKKETVWFALNSNRSPYVFAGIFSLLIKSCSSRVVASCAT